jgi:hypothetical protein
MADREVESLRAEVRTLREDMTRLAHVVALLADATQQQLIGQMSAEVAAGNLRNLNAQAAALVRG